MKILLCLAVTVVLFGAVTAFADEAIDGKNPLICATIEAIDCSPGEKCEKGLPEDIGAPQFLRIDFANKKIVGPKRTTEIRMMERNDEQITLQGYELDMGWTLSLDRSTGKMAITLAGSDVAFVVFGACTPLP